MTSVSEGNTSNSEDDSIYVGDVKVVDKSCPSLDGHSLEVPSDISEFDEGTLSATGMSSLPPTSDKNEITNNEDVSFNIISISADDDDGGIEDVETLSHDESFKMNSNYNDAVLLSKQSRETENSDDCFDDDNNDDEMKGFPLWLTEASPCLKVTMVASTIIFLAALFSIILIASFGIKANRNESKSSFSANDNVRTSTTMPSNFPTFSIVTNSPSSFFPPSLTPSSIPITLKPTQSPTFVKTVEQTSLPTSSVTSKPSWSPSVVGTSRETSLPTSSSAFRPSLSPTVTGTIVETPLPTSSSTFKPSLSPTDEPTEIPATMKPTKSPEMSSPTQTPTLYPTEVPTTSKPTKPPKTSSPTQTPTLYPTEVPTTSKPTKPPKTSSPTQMPTLYPTEVPTTSKPTKSPITSSPTQTPTLYPTEVLRTLEPTKSPRKTSSPTQMPTQFPTRVPTTRNPTKSPKTSSPTQTPTLLPTNTPTKKPKRTKGPTTSPTDKPTITRNGPNFPDDCIIWRLELWMDNAPADISWDLVDEESGDVVLARDNYQQSDARRMYSYEYCLESNSCQVFTIRDSQGNGMCCRNGNGGYLLYLDGEQIAAGQDFGNIDTIRLGEC